MKIRFSEPCQDSIFISIILKNNFKNHSFSIYQYDKNTNERVAIYPYQKIGVFRISLYQKKLDDYFFKVYTKNGADRESKKYNPRMIDCSNNAIYYRTFLVSEQSEKDVVLYISSFIATKGFFASFVSFKYKTLQMHPVVNQILLQYLLGEVYSSFAIKYLIYFLENCRLLLFFNELLDRIILLDERDRIYFRGVLYYRTSNIEQAKNEFFPLIKYRNELEIYQQGSLSYVNYQYISNGFVPSGIKLLHKQISHKNQPIMLASIDLGYLQAFYERAIENAREFNNALHLHLVAHDRRDILDLDLNFFIENNVGLSYEFISKDIIERSYYTISRYLVINDFLKIYERNIFICDIDLDVNKNIEFLLKDIENNKIVLYETNKDLPWVKYLAGISYFGYKTADSFFIKVLQDVLEKLYSNNRNLWTLDQVGLALAVEVELSNKNDVLRLNLQDFLSFSQFKNRQSSRTLAKKVVEKRREEKRSLSKLL